MDLQVAKHKLVTWLLSFGNLGIFALIDQQPNNQTQHISGRG
jgi:hypothetical protein